MSGNFWPIFVTVAALSTAVVWKYGPVVGQKLPPPLRDVVNRGGGHAPSDQLAPTRVQPDGATAPALANADAASRPAGTPEDGKSPKTPSAVTPTAQNPTGSPYLEPAAKALREYKRLLADFERRQKGMDVAAQRAAMKKLHGLNSRVEFLNRKHREWKESHPAASGLGR